VDGINCDSWKKAGGVLFTQPQSIISHYTEKEQTHSDSHHYYSNEETQTLVPVLNIRLL